MKTLKLRELYIVIFDDKFLSSVMRQTVLSLRKTTNAAISKVPPTSFTDPSEPQIVAHRR